MMFGLICFMLTLLCSLALGVVLGATIVRDFIERDPKPRTQQLPIAYALSPPDRMRIPAAYRRGRIAVVRD